MHNYLSEFIENSVNSCILARNEIHKVVLVFHVAAPP